MRAHLPAADHGGMDPAPAPYLIRIDGHLGATVLSAFPALAPRHHGAPTVTVRGDPRPRTSAWPGIRLYGGTNRARTGIGAILTGLCSDSRVPGGTVAPVMDRAVPMSMFDYDARPVTPLPVIVGTTASRG